jgi:hypothetical protein
MLVCFTQQAIRQTSFLVVDRIRNWFLHFVNIHWHLYTFSFILLSSDKWQQQYVYIYLSDELTWNTLSLLTILTYKVDSNDDHLVQKVIVFSSIVRIKYIRTPCNALLDQCHTLWFLRWQYMIKFKLIDKENW